MRVLCEPSLTQWPTGERRVIATGHQPSLWHPGILAKYLVSRHACNDTGTTLLNIVVDHDTTDVLTLDVPVIRDQRIEVNTLRLAHQNPNLPLCSHPPVDPATVLRSLGDARSSDELAVDLSPLIEVWFDQDLAGCGSLGAQASLVMSKLMARYHIEATALCSADTLRREDTAGVVTQMISNARACALAYNEAIDQTPDAGVRRLTITDDRVELPMWLVSPNEERRRVYVDVQGDVSVAGLQWPVDVKECLTGDSPMRLAPRALLLSALARSCFCDVFVHGTGGTNYDRVTERWWRNWIDQSLAPIATVSADVTLEFDAPVSTLDEARRAVWHAHHLPHNIDRQLNLTGDDVSQKRYLIEHMNDDGDRTRKAAAFDEIHRINDKLIRDHADAIEKANREAELARVGLINLAVAQRRDWCFALYPAELIKKKLISQIENM